MSTAGGMLSAMWNKTKEVAASVAKSTRKAVNKMRLKQEVAVLKQKIASINFECDQKTTKAFDAKDTKAVSNAVAMAKFQIIPIEVDIIEKESWIQVIDPSFVRSIPEGPSSLVLFTVPNLRSVFPCRQVRIGRLLR